MKNNHAQTKEEKKTNIYAFKLSNALYHMHAYLIWCKFCTFNCTLWQGYCANGVKTSTKLRKQNTS